MDNRNNGKMQSTKNRGKGVGTAKTKKAKIKIYVTIEYFQLFFSCIEEGCKIPFNRSGKAVLELSLHYRIIFNCQEDPPKKLTRRDGSLVKKGSKAPDVAG